MTFEILETETRGTIIKVVGVGGAGGNAVAHMIEQGVQNVDFICANTDAQALGRISAGTLIQLGKTGLGAGAKPEAGRLAAEEDRDRIRDALRGAHMVFITAGMGGGTGTGAAPVVAEVAQELGILTVAVVTKPFDFEGGRRGKVAEEGLDSLSKKVNSLIVVLNERLLDVVGDEATQEDCFREADNVLHNACAGIAEIINVDGNVNVDFEDVKTIMSEVGKAMMGTATASGEDRARNAAESAIASPLLDGVDLSGARGVLVNITSSKALKLKETKEIMNTIRAYAAEDATVIFGTAYDENMGDSIRVTVVATGLGNKPKPALVHDRARAAATGTYGPDDAVAGRDPANNQAPQVWHSPRENAARVQALESSGMDRFDIPAFLR
ncbi:MAG: cell division protein FtsZ, partial [Limnobacter sp.]|nr:cell division protein FtsZ [Limnobacter sp.]